MVYFFLFMYNFNEPVKIALKSIAKRMFGKRFCNFLVSLTIRFVYLKLHSIYLNDFIVFIFINCSMAYTYSLFSDNTGIILTVPCI